MSWCNNLSWPQSKISARLSLVLFALIAFSKPAHSVALTDYPAFIPLEVRSHKILFTYENKCGLADLRGNIVVVPQYKVHTRFSDGLICVKDGTPGFFTTTADFYPLPGLRPLWRQGATLAYNPSRRLFWVRTSDGNKVGLATTSGDFLLPLRYDDIFPGQFDNADDPVGVRLEGTPGLVDMKGDWIVKGHRAQSIGNGYSAIEFTKGYQIVDRSGKPISGHRFNTIWTAKEGMYYFEELNDKGHISDFGYLKIENDRVKKVFRAKRQSLGSFAYSEGRVFACVESPVSQPSELAESLAGACRYFDKQGKMLHQVGYRAGSQFVNGRAIACRLIASNKQYCAWIDHEGKVLVEREIPGVLNEDLVDDQLAIFSGSPDGWLFYYADGTLKEYSRRAVR